MISGFRNWLKSGRFFGLARAFVALLDRLVPLLVIPVPEPAELLRRITMMERHIILPLKAAGIAMLLYSFYSSRWIGNVLGALEISVEWTQYFLWFYIAANLVVGSLLMIMNRLPLAAIQWLVYVSCLLDALFLSALTLVTGGYDSILYWLFLGLIVRSAVSVPRGTSQLMLNVTLSACYVLAGVIDISIAENLDERDRVLSGLAGPIGDSAEPLLLRLVLLLLMTVCSYGVQVLLERQRQAQEEAREFALREGQLKSAGRMAAEFVHQIKNPLAIINSAAYSLERAAKTGRSDYLEQIQIIQEEVERSDRIITQIMGYAQLSEGRVERVNVIDELQHAVDRVFPAGAGYPVKVQCDFGQGLPPLLMQRRHVSDTFINLLQNAREALEGKTGTVRVSAHATDDHSIEVRITDDGPGIPRDKYEKVFEPYYTTKEKGTGLGLASVKHNVELYGGKVRVESELGKGARFIVLFPARSLSTLPTPL
jgi:signal transduction histidine kinase